VTGNEHKLTQVPSFPEGKCIGLASLVLEILLSFLESTNGADKKL
jgi:hypothetical protein